MILWALFRWLLSVDQFFALDTMESGLFFMEVSMYTMLVWCWSGVVSKQGCSRRPMKRLAYLGRCLVITETGPIRFLAPPPSSYSRTTLPAPAPRGSFEVSTTAMAPRLPRADRPVGRLLGVACALWARDTMLMPPLQQQHAGLASARCRLSPLPHWLHVLLHTPPVSNGTPPPVNRPRKAGLVHNTQAS